MELDESQRNTLLNSDENLGKLKRLFVQTSLLTVKLTMSMTMADKSAATDQPKEVIVKMNHDISLETFPCIEIELRDRRRPRQN
jgi:hypothetical protein